MERRKVRRIKATASVGYSVGGTERPALTYDLSTCGCMLQSADSCLSVGERVELDFGEGLFLKGHIVWVRRRNAGVQFDEPLSGVAAKRLLFNVLGTGLQHALQGNLSQLVACRKTALSRRRPHGSSRFAGPRLEVQLDGAVQYGPKVELLVFFATCVAPLLLSAAMVLT